MGYKLLGFVIWQGAKLFLRRKLPGTRGRIAIGGVGAAILAAVVVAGRQAASDD